MIVSAGVGHTVLHNVTPATCGLPDFNGYITNYIYIQEFAQVIAIPVFPTEKRWMMRQFNGELFHIHPDMLPVLQPLSASLKTPWWVYVGTVFFGILIITSFALLIAKVTETF